MSEVPQPPRNIDVTVEVDTRGIFVLLLFMCLLAWGLGTKPGNRLMCGEGWAPSYIDCTKATST